MPTQVEALTDGVAALSNLLAALPNTNPSLPSDLVSQLQQVASSFAAAQSPLRNSVQGLLGAPALPTVQTSVEGLLSQLETDLQTFAPRLQSTAPAGGCFTGLQGDLVAAISKLTSQLQADAVLAPANSQLQPQDLIAALENIETAVGQVDPCAPGLQTLQQNDQGVLAAISELAAGIQAH